jgi:hypothetical protein
VEAVLLEEKQGRRDTLGHILKERALEFVAEAVEEDVELKDEVDSTVELGDTLETFEAVIERDTTSEEVAATDTVEHAEVKGDPLAAPERDMTKESVDVAEEDAVLLAVWQGRDDTLGLRELEADR